MSCMLINVLGKKIDARVTVFVRKLSTRLEKLTFIIC